MTDILHSVPLSTRDDAALDEFEQAARDVIRAITDMRRNGTPVLPPAPVPGAVAGALPSTAPDVGEPLAAIVADFMTQIAPHLPAATHGGYQAYFSSSASPAAILGELITAAWNPNTMLWRTAPSAVELEDVVIGWVRQLLGLGDNLRGIINEGGSGSALHAVLAARQNACGEAVRTHGLAGLPPLRIYASEETHSSIDKAAVAAGLGLHAVHRTSFDDDGAFLRRAIAQDRAAGFRPMMIVGTAGSTSTGRIERLQMLADVAADERIWFHVDASYGGAAAMIEEERFRFDGWERADSIAVNPHKWMFVPIGCSILLLKEREWLRRALSLTPPYLERPAAETYWNPMDYGIALGRRANVLKLWFTLRAFGASALASRICEHIGAAREVGRLIDAAAEFELMAPVDLSVVAFRCVPRDQPDHDAFNARVLQRVNESGRLYISQTRVRNCFTLRLAVNNLLTTRDDVLAAWQLVQDACSALRADPSVHAQ